MAHEARSVEDGAPLASGSVAVPELSVAAIRRFCRKYTRPVSKEVALDLTVRGNYVTIWEWRRPLEDASHEWSKMPATQLRYDPAESDWSLCWRTKSRWEPYAVHLSLAKALKMISDDAVGAFFI